VKVIGYDSNGAKVGEDISDKPFTIEVVRVTSPNGGETLKTGNTHTIKWVTNKTIRPVKKVKVYRWRVNRYSGSGTYTLVSCINGNPGTYNWTAPASSDDESHKIKVVLKDELGNTIGSDMSDKFFTIQP
jgi:hypothetical protein